ncbi:unnamed protein product [Ambrosiozyma monospora]|uniref:Unnamed protein product n=1 Tax=Ambrosiozyma monospora TaxID=43982 RepID=A0A9W7DKB9_AMBMO|nr:unnamed protein product [Ambrosiozyma monospora]
MKEKLTKFVSWPLSKLNQVPRTSGYEYMDMDEFLLEGGDSGISRMRSEKLVTLDSIYDKKRKNSDVEYKVPKDASSLRYSKLRKDWTPTTELYFEMNVIFQKQVHARIHADKYFGGLERQPKIDPVIRIDAQLQRSTAFLFDRVLDNLTVSQWRQARKFRKEQGKSKTKTNISDDDSGIDGGTTDKERGTNTNNASLPLMNWTNVMMALPDTIPLKTSKRIHQRLKKLFRFEKPAPVKDKHYAKFNPGLSDSFVEDILRNKEQIRKESLMATETNVWRNRSSFKVFPDEMEPEKEFFSENDEEEEEQEQDQYEDQYEDQYNAQDEDESNVQEEVRYEGENAVQQENQHAYQNAVQLEVQNEDPNEADDQGHDEI